MGAEKMYDQDFYAWAITNAELLRQGRFSEIDIEHVAEELESMGKSERRELISRLEVLLVHLLKWKFQPGLRGASWEITILKQRDSLEDLLEESPSLRHGLNKNIAKAYDRARRYAAKETGLPLATFPDPCPFAAEQVLDLEFWPA
jgi:hypothetical protein